MNKFNRKAVYCTLVALTLATPAYAVEAVAEGETVNTAGTATLMEQESATAIETVEQGAATAVDTAEETAPIGQGDTSTSLLPEESTSPTEDLFGRKSGYIHPFIRIEESWTDNVFYTNDDEIESWITRVMPGIWLSLPRSKKLPVEITPNNTSAAGLQTQINDDQTGTERYQAFALANLDSFTYSEDSDLDTVGGNVQGLFRYNMRGGLSLQVLDAYTASNDSFRDTDASRSVREYDSNLAMATGDYQITEKFRLKADFSNFYLDYDDSLDSDLNRSDNAVDLYTYYLYSTKTSLFLEYKFANVDYDTASEKDNDQHYVYAGMDWRASDRIKLHAKAGYQKREYDDSVTSRDDWDGMAFELGASYRISLKTAFNISGFRSSDESDSLLAYNQTVTGIRFGYRQDLSHKFAAMVNGLWENSDYTNYDASDRTDNRYWLAPTLQYFVYDWLMTELTYSWDHRTSDSDIYEYTTHTLMLSLNISM